MEVEGTSGSHLVSPPAQSRAKLKLRSALKFCQFVQGRVWLKLEYPQGQRFLSLSEQQSIAVLVFDHLRCENIFPNI